MVIIKPIIPIKKTKSIIFLCNGNQRTNSSGRVAIISMRPI